MSEPTPQPAHRGNVLTRKLGPLPTWAWIGIAAIAVIAWAYWRRSKQQQSSDMAGAGQIPQFVNQVYSNAEPPEREDHEPDRDKHRRRHPRDRDHDRHHRGVPRETGSGGSLQGGKTPVPVGALQQQIPEPRRRRHGGTYEGPHHKRFPWNVG